MPHRNLKQKASTNDYTELIEEDCVITIPEYGRLLYKNIDFDSREIIKQLQKVQFNYRERTGGLKTRTESIGNKPRNPRRHDVCEIASLAIKHPVAHDLLIELAKVMTEVFRQDLPEEYERHAALLESEEILPEYLIPEAPFTSGVVNKNDAIQYHWDNGNVEGMMSVMIVFKNLVSGGFLSIPQLDIAFETGDCTVLIFDGKGLMHGVTPITLHGENAYRYSVVFYVRQGMWQCLSAEQELDRIREISSFNEQLNYEKKNGHKEKTGT